MSLVGIQLTDDLLEKAREKDCQAISQICSCYYPKVLKFMIYRTNPELAKDLTGEVFVKVIKSIDKQTGRFEPWLFRLARNVLIDSYRRVSARKEVEFDDLINTTSSEEATFAKEVGEKIDISDAMSMLSEEYRELITLKFILGMTNREISEITGQSLNAIRLMQFRALKVMKTVMSEGGKE